MTVIDLKKYIFENDAIEYILTELGCQEIKYHSQHNYYSATQPDGDNPQGVNIKNNQYLNYRSFTRNVDYADNKDLISLIESSKKIGFISAVKWLHKVLNLSFDYKSLKKRPIEEQKKDPLEIFKKIKRHRKRCVVNDFDILDENILNDYLPYCHINWFKEGITKPAIEKFKIGYSYNNSRIIIPHRYWLDGSLIGIIGRTTIDNYKELDIPKYFPWKSYPKAVNLYGLYENYETIQKAGYVVVYESEKAVLKRYSLNDKTGVALCCHNLSDEQVAILIGLNVEIILCMDNDVSKEEIEFMCKKFKGIRKVSYIYDEWDLLPEKSNPTDVKNKIYEFMFKYRKVYK